MRKKTKTKIKIDHSQCECQLLQRGPHWGLYCIPHGAYIKFLGRQELAEVMKLDIPMLYQNKSSN